MSSDRILFVLTSHGDLGDTGRATGWYLPEVAHPYEVLRQAGFAVDLTSTAGGAPPMDGADSFDPVSTAFLADPAVRQRLSETPRAGSVDPADYAAVFFAGGHGTMWDFPDDTGIQDVARAVYESGGVLAAVCHGPAALVNLTLGDGTHLVAGRRVAAFTDSEEAAVGLTAVVPFLLESTLRERGAEVVTAPDFAANVVVDGRLVTGQNPASAHPLAVELVRLLAASGAAVAR